MVAVQEFGPRYFPLRKRPTAATLKTVGGGATVTTYDASGTTPTPILVASSGHVSFYAPVGTYDLHFTFATGPEVVEQVSVVVPTSSEPAGLVGGYVPDAELAPGVTRDTELTAAVAAAVSAYQVSEPGLWLTDPRVGMVLDGTTDNGPSGTNALADAVALLGARGGTLIAPPGIGVFATQPGALPSNVMLRGQGKNASIFKKTYNGPLLQFVGASNASRAQRGGVLDLQLNGSDSTTGPLITGKWADHLNFDRVWCYGNADSAVTFENVWDTYFQNCEFEWCSGTNGLRPSVQIFSDASDSSNIIGFNQCRWESFRDGALTISGRAPVSAYTMVTGSNPPYGVYLSDCKMETAELRGYAIQMSADVEQLHVDGLYLAARGLYAGITTGRTLIDVVGASELTFKRIRVRVAGVTNPTVKTVIKTFTNAPGIVYEDIVVDAQQALGAASPGTGGGILEWAGGSTFEARVQGVRYKSGQSGVIDFTSGSGINPRNPTIASAATTMAFPRYMDFVNVSGTTGITSIVASDPGRLVTLRFLGALTLTDGGNLKLNGNLTTAADTQITLRCDGTNWIEVSRSPN